MNCNIFNGSAGSIKYAQHMKETIPITMTSNCGADAEDILSLDIQGNIRLCPHTEHISGKLTQLNTIEIKGMDLLKKGTHCGTCHVKRLCKSSFQIKPLSKTAKQKRFGMVLYS
jgi:radical SAM protein with 4Fe4S-binding SPASM domain